LKQKVLSCFFKTSVSEQRCKSSGNIFQVAGPEKLNPRSPNLVLVQRLTYLAVFAEHGPDRRLAEVTDRTASVQYCLTSLLIYPMNRTCDICLQSKSNSELMC